MSTYTELRPHDLNSESSYEPSDDGIRQRAHRQPPRVPFVWDGISRLVWNETDARAKALMGRNHMTYLSCKASPYAWQEILSDLTIFGPQQWLSDKAICRFLMDIWWPLRHEPQAGCAYLPLLTVHEISMAIGKRGRDSIGSHVGFQDGPFYSQYSSVIPQLPHRHVGFVLIRNLGSTQVATDSWTHVINNPNHFFAVVFDYDS